MVIMGNSVIVWVLKVNVAITNIVVFRKLGSLRQDEIWNYNGQQLEVVQ